MAMLVTEVDKTLWGRSIEEPRLSSSAHISLDLAQPWGGGRIEGRVDAYRKDQSGRYRVTVSCAAAWLDEAPQTPGKEGTRGSPISSILMHGMGIKIWLDEQFWAGQADLGELSGKNWLPFAFDLPGELPRAFEGHHVSFRWRIAARRQRGIWRSETSLPLILRDDRRIPTVRIETSPVGTWRFTTTRNDAEHDSVGAGCSVRYEDPRPGA